MDPRVCAATVAMAPIARAMAGRVIDANHRPGLVAKGVYPRAGNRPSPTAKTNARTRPRRKFGTAKATTETTWTTLSIQPPRTAASTPRPTPRSAVSTSAPMTRDMVIGSA